MASKPARVEVVWGNGHINKALHNALYLTFRNLAISIFVDTKQHVVMLSGMYNCKPQVCYIHIYVGFGVARF